MDDAGTTPSMAPLTGCTLRLYMAERLGAKSVYKPRSNEQFHNEMRLYALRYYIDRGMIFPSNFQQVVLFNATILFRTLNSSDSRYLAWGGSSEPRYLAWEEYASKIL
jgi:hypothetical protein